MNYVSEGGWGRRVNRLSPYVQRYNTNASEEKLERRKATHSPGHVTFSEEPEVLKTQPEVAGNGENR